MCRLEWSSWTVHVPQRHTSGVQDNERRSGGGQREDFRAAGRDEKCVLELR